MIELTQKDADFILKYIRADLERASEAVERLKKRQEELEKSCNKVDLKGEGLESLITITKIVGKAVDNDMNIIRHDLERCVELLTCGSEE